MLKMIKRFNGKSYVRVLIALCAFILFTSCSGWLNFLQNYIYHYGIVKGTVINAETHEPLSNVKITILPDPHYSNLESIGNNSTDSAGNYKLNIREYFGYPSGAEIFFIQRPKPEIALVFHRNLYDNDTIKCSPTLYDLKIIKKINGIEDDGPGDPAGNERIEWELRNVFSEQMEFPSTRVDTVCL